MSTVCHSQGIRGKDPSASHQRRAETFGKNRRKNRKREGQSLKRSAKYEGYLRKKRLKGQLCQIDWEHRHAVSYGTHRRTANMERVKRAQVLRNNLAMGDVAARSIWR